MAIVSSRNSRLSVRSIFGRLSTTSYLFLIIGVILIGFVIGLIGIFFTHRVSRYVQDHNTKTSTVAITAPVVGTSTIPISKELEDGYFISQTFNNCGPSALSMDLSYYGVHASQETLADDLRPTHNLTGKGDDKSTIPQEIVAEAEKYGFTAYYRPHGSIQLLKDFIANGIPVITRTLFKPSEDYGHYRVIKGYNDATGQIIDEDGYQGPEIYYSYADFMSLWQEYNYEYIVLVPPGKEALVQSIIGEDMNWQTAWQNAAHVAQTQGDEFNIAVADYYLGDYADSVAAFVKAQPYLPEHKLWYQMEPIESYYQLGDYPQVISLAQSILSNGDAVYPELYVVLGQTYEKEGSSTAATAAFAQALEYNKNLPWLLENDNDSTLTTSGLTTSEPTNATPEPPAS